MLPSVSVIYLIIYQKILISYHKQKERKNVLGIVKIFKLKKQFSARVTTSTAHHDPNNLLLQL